MWPSGALTRPQCINQTAGPGVIIGDWGRGEHYGEDMIGDLQNWANGWVDVSLACSLIVDTNLTRCGSGTLCWTCKVVPITCRTGATRRSLQARTYLVELSRPNIAADTKAGKLYYQIPYYYMGQITRFAVPDSYHIDTQVRPRPSRVQCLTNIPLTGQWQRRQRTLHGGR